MKNRNPDMGYDKEIVAKIESKNKQIEKLTQEVFELEKKMVLSSSLYSEEYETIKIKTGRKKTDFVEHRILKGVIKYTEGFACEDTGEVINIERNELVSINGVWCSNYGFAKKSRKPLHQTFYSQMKVWDEFPLFGSTELSSK